MPALQAACGLLILSATPARAQGPAPEFVPGQYIVVFKDAVADPAPAAAQMARQNGMALGHVYSAALRGFAATIPDARLGAVRNDPRVLSVEQDQVLHAFGQAVTPGVQTVPHGIRRIGTPGIGTRRVASVDVAIAIIDSGIQPNHPDLYVAGGYNATGGSTGRWEDGNGHGTHVAGTVAARDDGQGVVGVAPGAPLYAVKVLNNQGAGQNSWILAGVDWVTKNAAARKIRVANMSLGGANNPTLNNAITRSVNAGVTYVVAAGNSTADCAGTSPANHTGAGVITVSALADSDGQAGGQGAPTGAGRDDWIAGFSNNGLNDDGNGVDVIAPGVDVLSTYKGGGYATMSGTSMASPHVAGVAALCIARGGPSSPANVKDAIVKSPPYEAAYDSDYWGITDFGVIYGRHSRFEDGSVRINWKAINGDNDSGGVTALDVQEVYYYWGYEPLVNAGAFGP